MADFQHIIVVGLGLIGGSLAAACRRAFPKSRIVGVSRSREALRTAKKKGWIHEGYQNLQSAFLGVGAWSLRAYRPVGPEAPRPRSKGGVTPPLHLVVLCTPVDTLKDFLLKTDRLARPGTVVTDTGSVKGSIVRWAERRRWRGIRFVGSHPMAGSHERGIEHARADLFKGALTFVTPPHNRRGAVAAPYAKGRGNPAPTIKIVVNFWKKISGRVVLVSPEKHDRLAAEMSHLPHLVASLLVTSVSKRALRVAASGFLDTTRVAQGDPRLWLPIFAENRREVDRAIARFEANLARAKKILRAKDLAPLRRTLDLARERRARLEAQGK